MSFQSIMKLASIRKFVDENMPEGMYFDVFEIKEPSSDSDYSQYDAVIPVSSLGEVEKIEKLFEDIQSVKVFVICL